MLIGRRHGFPRNGFKTGRWGKVIRAADIKPQ
jgi:hypothetical protein